MSLKVDLSGRTALVTGASRGIGRAVAELLARAGARVAVGYRADAEAASRVAREVGSAGGEAKAIAADVSDPGEARRLVGDELAAWGRLDILVISAGIWEEDEAGAGSLATWDRTIAVNLRGAFLVTDAAIPHLEVAGG